VALADRPPKFVLRLFPLRLESVKEDGALSPKDPRPLETPPVWVRPKVPVIDLPSGDLEAPEPEDGVLLLDAPAPERGAVAPEDLVVPGPLDGDLDAPAPDEGVELREAVAPDDLVVPGPLDGDLEAPVAIEPVDVERGAVAPEDLVVLLVPIEPPV
jgi:hypothetical protein